MMRTALLSFACTWVAFGGPPVLTELQPRGAERGRPFLLTVVGRDIPEGAMLSSTMPASFTPAMSSDAQVRMQAGRAASFLVEPRQDVAPGVYPVRIAGATGISNILLFSVGSFPEVAEEESGMYSRPNRNDSIETAQPVQSVPVVLNGTLRGPERDLYRVYGKAGERRVFEVDAGRCG